MGVLALITLIVSSEPGGFTPGLRMSAPGLWVLFLANNAVTLSTTWRPCSTRRRYGTGSPGAAHMACQTDASIHPVPPAPAYGPMSSAGCHPGWPRQ
jgi:hypothetical protein